MPRMKLLKPIFDKHSIPQKLRKPILNHITVFGQRLEPRLEKLHQKLIDECCIAINTQHLKEFADGHRFYWKTDRRGRPTRLSRATG